MALTREVAFIDTSVLVNGLIEIDPADPAQSLMDAIAKGALGRPRTAWHCCLEFYSVATRLPAGLRISPADAGQIVEEEILGRCDVLDLPRASRLSFVRTAVQEGIAGGRIHDAHIAEVARAAGARVVLTENRRHFVPLLRRGVRVLTATEYVDELKL